MPTSQLHSPVRDDDALGPTEDLDRDLDGISHIVMASIVIGTFVVAAIVLLSLSGHVWKHPGALFATVIGVPVLLASIIVAVRNRRQARAHAPR